jgi:hypothetical protein
MKNVHVDGDGVFVEPHEEQNQEDGTENQPHCFFMEDLCDDYIHGQKIMQLFNNMINKEKFIFNSLMS